MMSPKQLIYTWSSCFYQDVFYLRYSISVSLKYFQVKNGFQQINTPIRTYIRKESIFFCTHLNTRICTKSVQTQLLTNTHVQMYSFIHARGDKLTIEVVMIKDVRVKTFFHSSCWSQNGPASSMKENSRESCWRSMYKLTMSPLTCNGGEFDLTTR